MTSQIDSGMQRPPQRMLTRRVPPPPQMGQAQGNRPIRRLFAQLVRIGGQNPLELDDP
jgi:hypothetical protein